MHSKQALRDSFALALANGLLMRYQEVPSAAFLAKEFNLRSELAEPITQESARRWLRGLAIPELDKLLVLRSWLDLDLNALGMPSIEGVEKRDAQLNGVEIKNQEVFIKTTQSIKESLQVLMMEVEHLEQGLGLKK
jgi:hypothetical protein